MAMGDRIWPAGLDVDTCGFTDNNNKIKLKIKWGK